MKWKNVKFWCWLELDFPQGQVSSLNAPTFEEEDAELSIPHTLAKSALLADDVPENLGAAQGPQGLVCSSPIEVDTVCFDLLSFASEFELNGIPVATVSVALGRRADDVNQAAQIHYYIDNLQLQIPARVWCLARTADSSDGVHAVADDWPHTKFMVFDGYATGSGFRQSGGGAELTLGLTHWLTDLNFSSAVSKQSHPLNPGQYFFDASFSVDIQDSGGGQLPVGLGLVSQQKAMPYFPPETVFSDFWGGVPGAGQLTGLKAWFIALTQYPRINQGQITNLASGTASTLQPEINWEACRALSRFEPNAQTHQVSEEGYVLGVPLGMIDAADFNHYIANAIANAVGLEGFETLTNVTLWDKLAGQFHSDYMFSIVPLVDKALVVPFVPGLSTGDSFDMVHRVIQTSEYDSIDLQAIMPRPLRAVGIIIGDSNEAGGGQNQDVPVQYKSFGGWFDKITPGNDPLLNPVAGPIDPRYKEGLIMLKEGPPWMNGFLARYAFTNDTTGVDDTVQTTNAPDAGKDREGPTLRELADSSQTIWDLYARTVYIHEVLKNRQGMISGPVRFDIAPGSQIMVEAAEDKFVKHVVFGPIRQSAQCDAKYYKFYWCSVLRVSTMIDCQNMRAFTNFYVAHHRNSDENKDPGTAIARHPLWQQCRWAGCVLVQDPAFGQQTTQDCIDDEE
jgi:hypothetical protein